MNTLQLIDAVNELTETYLRFLEKDNRSEYEEACLASLDKVLLLQHITNYLKNI